MSSSSSELNALGSTSTIDLYKRSIKKDASDAHYVISSKAFTAFWGLGAILFATYASLFENLIQAVNLLGSLFYGTILGIFIVGFFYEMGERQSSFHRCIAVSGFDFIHTFSEWDGNTRIRLGYRIPVVQCCRLYCVMLFAAILQPLVRQKAKF